MNELRADLHLLRLAGGLARLHGLRHGHRQLLLHLLSLHTLTGHMHKEWPKTRAKQGPMGLVLWHVLW